MHMDSSHANKSGVAALPSRCLLSSGRYSLYCESWKTLLCTISKTSVRVSSGFQTDKNHSKLGFLLFSSVLKPDETRSTRFYFSNKENQLKLSLEQVFSIQILYFRRENVILSRNCCSLTIFEYSSMSRYQTVSQFSANTLLRKAKGRVQIKTS